ncbi:MAG: TonB-dependent receptor, partial [Acidobacteriota bacterium]|nr:TonB-dependent receptor [Acidobacteriota bacterium]
MLFGLVALLGMATTVQAQITSGSIFGSVQDPTGAMIPNVTITATNASIGVSRTTTTSATGNFSLPNLPPGTYTLEATAPGFKGYRKSGVILNVADSLSAGTLVLEVGAASASVEVVADTGQLQVQSNSGDRSDLITNKQLNQVAMNGRNVLDYLRLVPGVSGVGTFGASGTGGLSSFNINGTRANSHEFTLDGSSNVDTGDNGGTHVTINTDAIAEVKILTSNYAAEFGKASGGQISVVSKGGANTFHGGAHFFHRNEGMNATGWYNNRNDIPKLLYRYNTEGYDIGGPIKRDKIFFFWSNEYYQQLVPAGTNSYYVPTTLERKGDFSKSYNSNGQLLTIYQPGTTTAYTGNVIPTASLNTSMQNIMNLYAQPNVSSYGVSQFTYNRVDGLSYNHPRKEFVARVDYQLTPGERLFVRWIGNRESTVTPMQTGVLQCMGMLQIVGGCKNTQPGWNLSADLTSTLGSHLLNEFNVGPSVYRTTWTGNNGNLSVGKNNVNLPLLYSVPSDTSIPDISYGGNGQNYPWSYYGANPWFQANTTINANDNLSWVKNNHSFKFGAFYQRSRKDQPAWGNYNGQFNFNNCATSNNVKSCDSATGSPYASALVGDFAKFDQSSSRPTGYFRYNQLEFYAQDTWQLGTRLTLNYGMRFVWIPPQYDAKDQIALFDPSSYVKSAGTQIDTNGNIVASTGNALEGMKYSADGSLPKGGWNDRHIMIEPRIGFAWDPDGEHKGVVRGGFGMSHDREQGNLVFNPTFTNPKNVSTPSISAATYLPLSSIKSATQDSAGVLGGIIGADRTGKVPTIYSFSLGVQREVGAGFSADIAYVGTMSRHLVTARDINTIAYGTTFTKAAQNPANFANGIVPNVEPNLPPEYSAAGYSFSGQYAYPDNYLAPYWGYDQLEYYKFDGTSNYNSLQASLQRRFGSKLTVGAVYTWSKSMTTSTNDESYVDPFNPKKYNYRVADWDRTNVAAVNYVYDLPAVSRYLGGSRVLSYLTDGYQISGVSNFMSGTPTSTAFWVQGSQLTGGRQWSKIAPAFLGIDTTGKPIVPKIGQPYKGTPERLRDGAMQTWDMSLFKNFPLGKSDRTVQIRCEAFNVFNHSNFKTHDLGANLTLPSFDS